MEMVKAFLKIEVDNQEDRRLFILNIKDVGCCSMEPNKN